MKKPPFNFIVSILLSTAFVFTPVQLAGAQKKMDGVERDRMKTMLKNIKNAIKDDY